MEKYEEIKKELRNAFEKMSEPQKRLAFDTIDEYIMFLEKYDKIRSYPIIRVSQKNPSIQKTTSAGKLIKEISQVIDSKRGTLLRLAAREGDKSEEELFAIMREFEA